MKIDLVCVLLINHWWLKKNLCTDNILFLRSAMVLTYSTNWVIHIVNKKYTILIEYIFFFFTLDISVLFVYGTNNLAITMWHKRIAIIFRTRMPCKLLNPFLVGEINKDLKLFLMENEFLKIIVVCSTGCAVRSTSAKTNITLFLIFIIFKYYILKTITINFIWGAYCSLYKYQWK